MQVGENRRAKLGVTQTGQFQVNSVQSTLQMTELTATVKQAWHSVLSVSFLGF